jgi:hypothetical protein
MDAGYANLEGAYVILETPLKAHTSCRLIVLFPPTDGRPAASAIASAEASSAKKRLVFSTELVDQALIQVLDLALKCWI